MQSVGTKSAPKCDVIRNARHTTYLHVLYTYTINNTLRLPANPYWTLLNHITPLFIIIIIIIIIITTNLFKTSKHADNAHS
jgi:hypothetical protein